MQFKYSTVENPSTYDTEGLCEGIPLRRHVAADLEEIGTFRAQEDWRRYVGPMDDYKGGLGPRFSFMTVSVPECLPDRLDIISYANELAFLHDGEFCVWNLVSLPVADRSEISRIMSAKRK